MLSSYNVSLFPKRQLRQTVSSTTQRILHLSYELRTFPRDTGSITEKMIKQAPAQDLFHLKLIDSSQTLDASQDE